MLHFISFPNLLLKSEIKSEDQFWNYSNKNHLVIKATQITSFNLHHPSTTITPYTFASKRVIPQAQSKLLGKQ